MIFWFKNKLNYVVLGVLDVRLFVFMFGKCKESLLNFDIMVVLGIDKNDCYREVFVKVGRDECNIKMFILV